MNLIKPCILKSTDYVSFYVCLSQVNVRFMLLYECEEAVCIDRVLKRQEGRADDTDSIVRKRIAVSSFNNFER